MKIVTAPLRNSRHWTAGQLSWKELLQWMENPGTKKAAGNYIIGELRETTMVHERGEEPCTGLHRSKTAVVNRGALTLDVDTPEDDFLEKVRDLNVKGIIHTTFSSTSSAPRYRLIIPFSRAVLPDEYAVAAETLMGRLGHDSFDPGSSQPERYMFKPAGNDFWWEELTGPVLKPEELLKEFAEDLHDAPIPRTSTSKRDPFELEGTIGAFNRAYADFAFLIEEYDLPYEPSGEGRWKLVGAAAAAGMGEVRPGLVFSHHSNDPAAGAAQSAFDLARVHLYGHLDEQVKAGTPVNRVPSHKAMLETATRDINVVRELVGSDFADEMSALADGDDEPAPDNWKLGLARDPRSGKPTDVIGNWDLIVQNDPVFKAVRYNEMAMAIEVDSDLPWRRVTPGRETFDAGDRSSFALYVERQYSLRAARTYLDDLLNDCARRRRFNPVKDYLKSLKWDGEPRLETCLPGVRETSYTRLVARKVMVAAVARMLDPGCKWDHMLVLYGAEGLGKSWWVERMSLGFSASLGRIGDKDTLIAMQRSWIMTSDEGHALKKADFDAQKEFLTRTADVFRMPYEREAQLVKRHCVIWGTTNDEVFLRRQEGNRRFLIVRCEEKFDFDRMTPEYIAQVWAEAVHYYSAGEALYLSEDENDIAALNREPFIEEDSMVGMIEAYLDKPVPENWDDMAPLDRQMYMLNGGTPDELSARPTGRIDQVCSVQIWVEALGRRYGEQKRMDLLDISRALREIPGWVKSPSQQYSPGYGKQTVYQRVGDDEDIL